MALLDTIRQMQEQGIGEVEMLEKLREEGYNPREVSDAIDQSRIKVAISESEEMMPSMMTPEAPEQAQVPGPAPPAPTPEYMYPTPQAYPAGYEYYQPQAPVSTEMITEVAEQIIVEKLADMKKNLSILTDFKTLIEARVTGIDERLKKIESILDKLQLAILGKIGNYGQSIQDIKDEMQMMQESFSKVISPLTRKAKEASEEIEETPAETKETEAKEKMMKKKTKPSFEDYLRT